VHDIYREWRAVTGDAALVAEARLRDPARTARYVRPGEMDQAFNFQFLWAPWDFDRVRAAVEGSLASMTAVGALPSWVIGNHDEIRAATRYALDKETDEFSGSAEVGESETGLRRARAMALLSLALPGSAYVYQGDELGLPEVVDLPDEVREDPIWHRSGGKQPGRDGCRVPLPWTESPPSRGFGPAAGKAAWLPQPESWQGFSVAAQLADPGSTLTMYQRALKLRRHIGSADLAWLEAPPGVLAFSRGKGFACAVNFGGSPVPLADLPLPGPVVLMSASDPTELKDGAAVWAATPSPRHSSAANDLRPGTVGQLGVVLDRTGDVTHVAQGGDEVDTHLQQHVECLLGDAARSVADGLSQQRDPDHRSGLGRGVDELAEDERDYLGELLHVLHIGFGHREQPL
jgi:alpha-glucosidase